MIRYWVVGTEGASRGGRHGLEVLCPVSVPVGILAAHPANEITIDEMEARQSASVEIGSSLVESGR